MKHNTYSTGLFLYKTIILGKTVLTVFLIVLCMLMLASCNDSFLHDALYTKTLTISIYGKNGTLFWIDDRGNAHRQKYAQSQNETTHSPLTAEESSKGIGYEDESGAETTPATEEPVTLSITVSKEFVTPVLFLCEKEEHPQGFIYPLSTEFTDTGGFAAHILYRLIKDSDETSSGKNDARSFSNHFNWKKFQELIEQAVEKNDNPWEYDQTRILGSIADGTFTANMLR